MFYDQDLIQKFRLEGISVLENGAIHFICVRMLQFTKGFTKRSKIMSRVFHFFFLFLFYHAYE